MKPCTVCSEVKPLEDFPIARKIKSGRDGTCKVCCAARQRAYYAANSEKCRAYHKNKRATDPEFAAKADLRSKVWAVENKERRDAWRARRAERLSASFREWRLANPDKMNAKKAARRARIAKATLPGPSKQSFEAIYERARLLTEVTGVEHHVDHVVPLKGKTVCGLHVPWNLQCLPAVENHQKKNRF